VVSGPQSPDAQLSWSASVPGRPAPPGACLTLFLLEAGRIPSQARSSASTSGPQHRAGGRRLIRQLVSRGMVALLPATLGMGHPDLGAAPLSFRVAGLVLARVVTQAEPLASAPVKVVAGALGPLLKAALTGPLPAAPRSDPGRSSTSMSSWRRRAATRMPLQRT
jgi:hypothetical protein